MGPQRNPCYQCLSVPWPVPSATLVCSAKRQTHSRPPVPFCVRAEILSDIRHGKWASAASRVKRLRLDHPGQIKQPFHVWSACSPKDKSHWVLSLNSGPMFPLRCRCNFLAWLLWLLHTGGKLICYQRIVIKFTANTSVVLLELWYVMRGKCTAYIIGHCHYSMLSLIVFKWSYSSGIKIVAHRNTKLSCLN